MRKISITGEISEDNSARAIEITELIKSKILPDVKERYGIDINLSGLFKQERDFLNDALIGFLLCLIGIYLALAWVFASWARPIVVMSIIPFGLIGTLWGHYLWGINLSMFSIIGLIGMTGIIINDSIVLVSTIDEYSKNRGLKPAIVDAICDRLRPVLLTTLTTVLGLAPLLFETSKDAQFLKPTIVTLVYGLGFGMLIVLFLVPSILLIQRDFADLVRSFKRIFLTKKTSILIKLVYSISLFLFSFIFFFLVSFFTDTSFDFFNFQTSNYLLFIPLLLVILTCIIIFLLPAKVSNKKIR